ncbi:RecF/RecN/SMC [Tribonema minus]|uniref:Structural maintenance of chromosomes protein n=1 Tax=Tribonema minus TaxID=303371 RepID=A0A836CH46_9STRA|nr:RecF/RecN/SMC [Tribonema minus]
MHIKQVIISGFRSFRSQAETEPFSPRHNVIVGRNGSGKSNFFDAIQFVLLNQKFQNLRQEERQHLLHEGAGANVMSAFVEIVFDNSDGRLPVDGDEVVLRRTIGLKKDEFFLNRKRVTKADVSSLLESAGFSKSNPYYIVQQGKVSALTMMHDTERLNLLKEVAGTKVYEERRAESLKIMSDTADKRARIQEVITYIEDRLRELEGEKDELGAYQQLDRERRALEYVLYDKELRAAREELERLEDVAADAERMEALHESLRAARDAIGAGEGDLAEHRARAAKLEQEKAAVDEERTKVIARRAALELEVKEIMEGLEALERTIATKEQEMERVAAPAHAAAKEAAQAAEARLNEAAAEAEDLYKRQSRHSQFSSAAERDAALRKQVKEARAAADAKRGAVRKVEAAAAEMRAQIKALRERASELEEDISSRRQVAATAGEAIAQRLSARNATAEERKDRWRALEELQDRKAELKAKWDQGKRDLRAATPRAISEGLEHVQRIVKEEKMTGVLGPVIENLELTDPKYAAAVEAAAGNSLFNVIVDNDATAARLVEKLERGRLGRLTFMPLSQLRPKVAQCPESGDVVPLLEVALRFEPKVAAAMQQVFGRKLLASGLAAAAAAAEAAGADAVTLEGDEVGRKGGISGGYRDASASRLGAVRAVREAGAALRGCASEAAALKEKVTEADQAVTNIMGEIQRLEAKRDNARHLIDSDTQELAAVRRQVTAAEQALGAELEKLPALQGEADQEDSRAALVEREIGTPLEAGLPPAEKARLAELNGTVQPALRREVQQRLRELEAAAAAQQRLEALLRDNLQARREDLRARLAPQHGGFGGDKGAAAAAARTEALALRRGELESVERALEGNRRRLARIEQALLEGRQAARELQDELESLRQREARDAEALADAAKQAERCLGKRTLAVAKRDANTRKIQELGSLPTAELQRFGPLPQKELMKKLHRVNEKLKKYSHVNKKAFDQFVSFGDQRRELLDRQADLDKGDESIQELIAALDRQKDEAIQNTFRSVSKHFSEVFRELSCGTAAVPASSCGTAAVFRELVPHGSGQMVMLTHADDEEDGEEDGEENGEGEGGAASQPGAVSVSQYTGVQIRVSFTGTGEAHLMSQLSGGQKALVALALIFAIQRCDPAPFYLFDEIDQALDSSYRGALAALIQRQASMRSALHARQASAARALLSDITFVHRAHSQETPTQFITTTFRPELVSVAARAYGISHQNKVSNIELMTREEALGFVAEILHEEEAVGTKLAQPTAQRRTVTAATPQQHRRGGGGGGTGGTSGRRGRAPSADENEENGDSDDASADASGGGAPADEMDVDSGDGVTEDGGASDGEEEAAAAPAPRSRGGKRRRA